LISENAAHSTEMLNSYAVKKLSNSKSSSSASIAAFTPLGKDFAQLRVVGIFVYVIDADMPNHGVKPRS